MDIAIYGKSGSGKTTVAQYLAERHGFVRCHLGARCRELALELFGMDSKDVLNRLSDSLRDIDEEVWIKAAANTLNPSKNNVIDGIRFPHDFDFFRARSFSLWRVRASAGGRHDRLAARRQDFGTADDAHPGENLLDGFPFDVTLDNDGDRKNLFEQIDLAVAGRREPR